MVYVALIRGINVGGNNKVSMAELKTRLEDLGLENVRTYINSGNVIFSSDKPVDIITKKIESAMPHDYKSMVPVKVLVVSQKQVEVIIKKAPKGFGQEPTKYHSDVAFLIGRPSAEALEQNEVNPEVDKVWAGDGVLYYRRLSAMRVKSKMPKIASKPIYKFMTIRSWSTVQKLADLMQASS